MPSPLCLYSYVVAIQEGEVELCLFTRAPYFLEPLEEAIVGGSRSRSARRRIRS